MTETKQEVALIPYREPTGGDMVKAFIPNDFASVYRFAELLAESGEMVPKDYKGQATKIATAIFFGYEIGLLPLQALQSIAVINGKPSIYGDAALALVRATGQLEVFEEFAVGELYLAPPEFSEVGVLAKAGKPNPDYKAVCRIKRKGGEQRDYEFSVLEAIEAGLYNKDGPWRNYRKRMLKMRARSFALRDEFTDVMRGMALAEEVQDYVDTIDHEQPPAAREEPPAGPKGGAQGEVAAPARKRKPKEDNKYQDADGKGATGAQVEDAEVLETKTSAGAKGEEDPPAGKAKADAKAEVKQDITPASEAAAFRDSLLMEIGADKPLKDHIVYINDLLMPHNTIETMKAAWDGRDKMTGLVATQVAFVNRMRDHHKDRINAIGTDEDPPAAEKKVQEEKVFDYAGFLHALDVELGKQKTPDDVNKVYAQITTAPIKEGIVSADQIENELKTLLAEHLERTDFGN